MPKERSTDPEKRAFLRCCRARRKLKELRQAVSWWQQSLQERGEVKFARECHVCTCAEHLAEQVAKTLTGYEDDEDDDE
jgi:hypothetical protein